MYWPALSLIYNSFNPPNRQDAATHHSEDGPAGPVVAGILKHIQEDEANTGKTSNTTGNIQCGVQEYLSEQLSSKTTSGPNNKQTAGGTTDGATHTARNSSTGCLPLLKTSLETAVESGTAEGYPAFSDSAGESHATGSAAVSTVSTSGTTQSDTAASTSTASILSGSRLQNWLSMDATPAAGTHTSSNRLPSSTASSSAPAASAVLDMALEQLVQCLTPPSAAWSNRQALVDDHIQRLQQAWKCSHPIRVSSFGSTLSGLCLADSDIDLGLFGTMHGCQLEALTPQQAKKLLYSVLSALHRANLVAGKVETVMGARVPVLKYKCALSGLDCDVSVQGSGALVKANIIKIINQHCPALSPLYRLVKLWAAAHDLNDASRSTFNSTSLLYLTMFYLQLQQLLPPLKELVESNLLNAPSCHLLHPSNKRLWDRPEYLSALLSAVQQRAVTWVRAQKRHHGTSWGRPSLGSLLQGFFDFYSDIMTSWVLGKRREAYADLWAGQLTTYRPGHEQLGKDYVFNLQDPFDPVDCPARAIGTLHKTNNGVGVLISYLTVCSSKVLSVYQHGSGAGSSSSIRGRLCQCLAWLFGPQAVLHLAPAQGGVADSAWNGPTDGSADAQSAADWHSWATSPFDTQLVDKLQRQLSKQTQGSSKGRGRRDSAATPGGIFKWLVNALQAALEPDSGPPVLCLSDLHLLNKRIAGGLLEGRLGAALAAGAAGRRAAAQEQRQQLDGLRREWQQQRLLGPPLPGVDASILRVRDQLLAVMRAQRWQPRMDSKPRPPDSMSKVVKEAARVAITHVALRMQHIGASTAPQLQQRQVPLAQPHRHPAQDRVLSAAAVAAAAAQEAGDGGDEEWEEGWEEQLQDVDDDAEELSAAAAAAGGVEGDAEGIGGFGLLAVLQQHGFMEALDTWCFVQDGVLWHKLLPFPEHLQQESHSTAGPSGGGSLAAGSPAPPGQLDRYAAAVAAAEAATQNLASSSRSAGSGLHTGLTGTFLQHRQQQPQARHQNEQQVDLQVDFEVQDLSFHRSVVSSSSSTMGGLTHQMQQLTVGVETTRHHAAAGSSRGHGQQGHRQHAQPGQQLLDQHGQPLHLQPQPQAQQERQPHQQVSQPVRIVPRPRQRAAAVDNTPAGPEELEPGRPQAFATHGDTLVESYCRQLQEKLSSPPTKPLSKRSPKQQQQHSQAAQHVQQQQPHSTPQQRKGERRHPAADLLSSCIPPAAAAAGPSSSAAAAIRPSAAQASVGAAGSARVLQQAANGELAKLHKQLRVQEKQLLGRVSKRLTEVQQLEARIAALLGSACNERALSQEDRQQLLVAKNSLRSSQVSLRSLQKNLARVQGQLQRKEAVVSS